MILYYRQALDHGCYSAYLLKQAAAIDYLKSSQLWWIQR